MGETTSRLSNPQDGKEAIPAPTIVGPRPEEARRGKISVPRGLERLLVLAGLSQDWKLKTLKDPVGAASEAKIELSASESAILHAVSPKTLGNMIASFARNRLTALRGPGLCRWHCRGRAAGHQA